MCHRRRRRASTEWGIPGQLHIYYRRRGTDLLAGQLDPAGWVDAGQVRRWRPFKQVAGPVGADGADGVFCCGLRVISVDGSTTDLPDSEDNVAFFRRPSSAARDGACPQVRWVAAAESGTGALTGAAFSPYTTGEQTLALDLLPCFGPGMLVLAGRNFLSRALARDVLATGAHILRRA